jgi:transposase InsO family protein
VTGSPSSTHTGLGSVSSGCAGSWSPTAATYFAWVRAQSKRCARERDEQRLAQLITEVHTAQPAYGVQRVTRGLQRRGVPVGRRVVVRLMRALGMAGVTRRNRRNLTKPDAGASAVPDLIRRDFTARMPGLKLVGDISCFPTAEGWLYLATVLDLCSKELIGYAIAPYMRASLAVDAITAARRTGLVAGNAIMYTDRGGHARTYRNALGRLEIRQSTSRSGSCLTAPPRRPSSPRSRRRSASTRGPTVPPRYRELDQGLQRTTYAFLAPVRDPDRGTNQLAATHINSTISDQV